MTGTWNDRFDDLITYCPCLFFIHGPIEGFEDIMKRSSRFTHDQDPSFVVQWSLSSIWFHHDDIFSSMRAAGESGMEWVCDFTCDLTSPWNQVARETDEEKDSWCECCNNRMKGMDGCKWASRKKREKVSGIEREDSKTWIKARTVVVDRGL